MTLGARELAELGDAPNRYADARPRKNYSGMSPQHPGSRRTPRRARARRPQKRLADACYLWAFATLTASPGARAFYDEHRIRGDTDSWSAETA